jgi:hypothetical protein
MATIKYKDENGQWQEIAIGGGESVEVVDNLESESTTAALSANQGRVLKEKMVVLRELLQGDSGEIKAYNLETLQLVKENKALAVLNGVVCTYDGVVTFYYRGYSNGIMATACYTINDDGGLSVSVIPQANSIIVEDGNEDAFNRLKEALRIPGWTIPNVYIDTYNHPVQMIIHSGDSDECGFVYMDEYGIYKITYSLVTYEPIEHKNLLLFN